MVICVFSLSFWREWIIFPSRRATCKIGAEADKKGGGMMPRWMIKHSAPDIYCRGENVFRLVQSHWDRIRFDSCGRVRDADAGDEDRLWSQNGAGMTPEVTFAIKRSVRALLQTVGQYTHPYKRIHFAITFYSERAERPSGALGAHLEWSSGSFEWGWDEKVIEPHSPLIARGGPVFRERPRWGGTFVKRLCFGQSLKEEVCICVPPLESSGCVCTKLYITIYWRAQVRSSPSNKLYMMALRVGEKLKLETREEEFRQC